MIISYLTIFGINLCIELFVAFIIGNRKKEVFGAVVAVNAITHPLLSLLIYMLVYMKVDHILIILILEVIVIVAEWCLLIFILRKKDVKYLLLAVIMNLISYTFGLLFM